MLIIDVRSKDEIAAIRSQGIWRYRIATIPRPFPQGTVRWPGVYSFPDIGMLSRIMLESSRLEIINALTGQKAMSIRALSRRVERAYPVVYRDVQTLLAAGVIGLDDKGKLTFPYGEVRFNFSVTGQALVNTSPREAMP
ncbi:hypothetical protein G5W47_001870 [Salmonella enterica subsp. enterica]|uniref:Uncharacterized protein n=1 Tax=Salmonella diarizonae TaxID=59204 RepID=A0A5U3CWU7_SALDZ|nr:hypothetical protein [Salmonella enterica subsp. diarizonae]EBQ3514631.1 hypothetical protein [Salmonella enterica]EEN6470307.1 hypothetical protein [Salmonella enterica subsp. enterica]EBP3694692.1 hypothetical protein [Salmonella enterica subsp. diarizonae]EBQ3578318.1 hypothetical protein [Salmonella enterica]